MPTLDVGQRGKPWPGYFLVRKESGAIVPLIAVDELPLGVDVVNAPRHLELEGAVGMLNLGIVPGHGCHYEIRLSDDLLVNSSAVEGTDEIQEESTHRDAPASTAHIQSPTNTPNTAAPSTSSTSRTEMRTSLPQKTKTTSQSSPATQLCRHWCHHGICKWGQQCRYRHIMPMNLPGLQEVGLTDWPAWYRALNPGYFVSEAPQNPTVTARSGRGRIRAKHDRDCCGRDPVEKAIVKGTSAGKFAVKEKATGRVFRREELGERIVKQLREMSREGKRSEKAMNGGGMAEKAVGGGTRRWEDQSDEDGRDRSDEDEQEEEKPAEKQGKLVDV